MRKSFLYFFNLKLRFNKKSILVNYWPIKLTVAKSTAKYPNRYWLKKKIACNGKTIDRIYRKSISPPDITRVPRSVPQRMQSFCLASSAFVCCGSVVCHVEYLNALVVYWVWHWNKRHAKRHLLRLRAGSDSVLDRACVNSLWTEATTLTRRLLRRNHRRPFWHAVTMMMTEL